MPPKNYKKILLSGNELTISDVASVARQETKVHLSPKVLKKINLSLSIVKKAVKNKTRLYGFTTGFGKHANFFLENSGDAEKLQENVITSHIVSVGDYLDEEITRAVMLLRANTLAKGYSGVRPELIQRLINLINARINPLIPEKGSVGASGDLSPLAYMTLPLIGKGKVLFRNKIMDAKTALRKVKINPNFKLSYKEGIALTNGTSVMTAIGSLTYYDALNLIKAIDITAALSLESVCGKTRAFDEKLHRVRPFYGQMACADNIRKLIKGSSLIDSGNQVQDSYSIRCIPQVHGASWEALEYVRKVLETELNSVNDNPLLFAYDRKNPPLDGKIEKEDYSGGNFHGQPLSIAMDLLGMALAQLGNISERRIQKLLDENHSQGLPSNLIEGPGLNSGLMIAQYTAAALVSENKILAHPACVDSIPTSANVEDFVSMGTIAARKARQILENVRNIVAIELLCATQALDFRMGRLKIQNQNNPNSKINGKPGRGTLSAYNLIRKYVKPLKADRELDQDINNVRELIKSEKLTKEVEKTVGKLYSYKNK